MNLEKINKTWITAKDFSEAIGIGEKFAHYWLELAGAISMKRVKKDGVIYYAGLNEKTRP